MLPVVLGILIALLINNWKEKLDDKRFINRVFDSLEKEMKSNEVDITEVLPTHYALLDTIDRYKSDERISLSDIIIKGNGLQAPTVKNTSWNSFLNSKLELIDYNTISILTEIEESKHLLKSKLDNLMNFLLEKSESTDAVIKQMLMFQLMNVVSSEKELLELYEKYLEKGKKTSH